MCCMEDTYTSSYGRGRTTFLSLLKLVYFTYTVRGIRYTDVFFKVGIRILTFKLRF